VAANVVIRVGEHIVLANARMHVVPEPVKATELWKIVYVDYVVAFVEQLVVTVGVF
jgi:hypothetical protein